MSVGLEPGKSKPTNANMYLVLPLPFRITNGRVFVELQAGNGLDRWSENFAKVIVAAPVIPDEKVNDLSGFVWRPMDSLEHSERITFQALPYAYTPASFFRQLGSTRELLSKTISENRYLQFGVGGLLGDWAAVASLEAIRQKRRYAIHTDRVEHEVLRNTMRSLTKLRRLKATIEIPLMERYHRHIIRRCSLGLWHGDDCFRAYSPWCKENHRIHDIHTKEADLIDESTLVQKIERAYREEVLDLCYVGRLDPMKAPLEWLQAIAAARDKGVRLRATWYGEGPLLDAAKAEAARLNLTDIVQYPGFIADRPTLLNHLRSAHALVFTHVTPESPRNLLESLVSGTPILGYENAFAADLLEGRGGGALVPIHDVQSLGDLIWELGKDRQRLADLTQHAAANGRRFTDSAVFAQRSELIKKYA